MVLSLPLLAPLVALAGCAQAADPEWLPLASALQRYAGYGETLDKVAWVATHNSFSYDGAPTTHSPFEIVSNQIYSILTQLNCFGVRGIELDPRWVEDLESLLVCHVGDDAANDQYSACQAASWQVCNSCGIQNYGPDDTGCSKDAPTLAATLADVAGWLDDNPTEFLFVKLDSHLDDKAELASDAIRAAFEESAVYGPSDYDEAYPTQEALLAAGKRVAFFGREASSLVFLNSEDRKSPKDFAASRPCGGTANATAAFHRVQGVATDVEVAVAGLVLLSDASAPDMFLGASVAAQAMACGISPTFDRINATLAEATIWSWAEGHPDTVADPAGDRCAYVNAADGRWRDDACSSGGDGTRRRHACRADADRTDWTLTDAAAAFGEEAPDCGVGYTFGAPRNAAENVALRAALDAAGAETTWISYRSGSGSSGGLCWTLEAEPEHCYVDNSTADATCAALANSDPPTAVTCNISEPLGDSTYLPPPYSPNGVVADLHRWGRLSGSNQWQADDPTYIKGILFAMIPFFVVGLMMSILLLPCVCSSCFNGGGDNDEKEGGSGSRRAVAMFAFGVLLVLSGAAVAIVGLVHLGSDAEATTDSIGGLADDLISSEGMAAELDALLVSCAALTAEVAACPQVDSTMVFMSAALVEARSGLSDFLEADLGGLGKDIHDGLDTAAGDAQGRTGVIIALAVLVAAAALSYTAILCTSAGRNGGGNGGAKQARRVGCITCVLLPTTILGMFLSWIMWGVSTSAGLYSADFCVAPRDNLVASVPDKQADTVSYYVTCEGTVKFIASYNKAYAYAFIGQGLTADLVAGGVVENDCPDQNDALLALQKDMDAVVVIAGDLGTMIACSSVNPSWVLGVEQSACSDVTVDVALVMAGFATAAVLLMVVVLGFRAASAAGMAAEDGGHAAFGKRTSGSGLVSPVGNGDRHRF